MPSVAATAENAQQQPANDHSTTLDTLDTVVQHRSKEKKVFACALYKVIFHTTLALILDGCNGTFSPPVDASRKRINANIFVPKSGRNLHWARFEALVSLGRPELSIGEVGELVDAKPELAIPSGIERLDEFDVGLEHLETLCLLGIVLVDAAVLAHPQLVPRCHGRVISQIASRVNSAADEGAAKDGEEQSLATGGHGCSCLLLFFAHCALVW